MSHCKPWTTALGLTLLACTAPDGVRADVTASYTTKNGTMTIHYASPERVRIDLSEPGGDSSVVLRGPKTYIIGPGGEAVDMDEWLQQMQGLEPDNDAADAVEPTEPEPGREVEFEPTGQSESVAGVTGEIYQVRISGPDGAVDTQEQVLTANEEFLEMWQFGMVEFFNRWGRMSPDEGEPWFLPLAERQLGLLRAEGYELVDYHQDPIDPDRFAID